MLEYPEDMPEFDEDEFDRGMNDFFDPWADPHEAWETYDDFDFPEGL
jgi:hypothetical protein